MKAIFVGLVAIIPLMAGCGSAGQEGSGNGGAEARSGGAAADNSTQGNRPTVLFLGTSLTAGYGLSQSQAFPAVIGRMADSAGKPITVVNAGISGETSAGLLGRIDWAMRTKADIIFIETGANDGLRAFPVPAVRSNLSKIVRRVKEKQPGAQIILVPMQMPPNLGFTYSRDFRNMYAEVAEEERVILAPFLLEGVGGSADLNQDDGIHPNARGAEILAQNMWKVLEDILS